MQENVNHEKFLLAVGKYYYLKRPWDEKIHWVKVIQIYSRQPYDNRRKQGFKPYKTEDVNKSGQINQSCGIYIIYPKGADILKGGVYRHLRIFREVFPGKKMRSFQEQKVQIEFENGKKENCYAHYLSATGKFDSVTIIDSKPVEIKQRQDGKKNRIR